MSQIPDASAAGASEPAPSTTPSPELDHPHNFDVQKDVHQRIRNDPDYDDWEYGTEPLPHEAWVAGREPQATAPAPKEAA